MKFTLEQITQIIKEEIAAVLSEEMDYSDNILGVLEDAALTFVGICDAIDDLQVGAEMDKEEMITVQEDLETLIGDGTVVADGVIDTNKNWSPSDPEWDEIEFSLPAEN